MNQKELMRFHRNRQAMHDAYVYLGCFAMDCVNAVFNQRYRSEEELGMKIMEILAKYFGNREQDGQLQNDLNEAHQNILRQLQQDFPHFDRAEILVFSYYAVGLPVSLICVLAGLSCKAAVSITKTQMKNQILTRASARREEYLRLLTEREKRDGVNNWL